MKIEFVEFVGYRDAYCSEAGLDIVKHKLPQFKINDLDGFRVVTLSPNMARAFRKMDVLKLQEEYDWLCQSVKQCNHHIVELTNSMQERDVTPHLTHAYVDMMESFVKRLRDVSEERIAVGAALKWIADHEELD